MNILDTLTETAYKAIVAAFEDLEVAEAAALRGAPREGYHAARDAFDALCEAEGADPAEVLRAL